MKIEKLVLMMDDDEDDRDMLQKALQSIDTGHTIIAAHDGKDGLNQLRQLRESNSLHCLVVLDINMPKMVGKQTFVAIKDDEELSKIPVVIFSTSTNPMDRMFFEKHDTAYFVKPINVTDLADAASR